MPLCVSDCIGARVRTGKANANEKLMSAFPRVFPARSCRLILPLELRRGVPGYKPSARHSAVPVCLRCNDEFVCEQQGTRRRLALPLSARLYRLRARTQHMFQDSEGILARGIDQELDSGQRMRQVLLCRSQQLAVRVDLWPS